MAISTLVSAPRIIEDPRCTPDDTFATWYLRNRWPVLLQNPHPYKGKTFAERWDLTRRALQIDPALHYSETYRCKACGVTHSSNNPLLWGNLEIARARGHDHNIPIKWEKTLIYAQDPTVTSGDTDFTLFGHHTTAAVVYCLACTLMLSTRVMDHAFDSADHVSAPLSFYWTPLREEIPWTSCAAIWELPRERPLIFRAVAGPGKNHDKWGVPIPINWDPQTVVFPLTDRDGARGTYWLSVSSERLATLPQAFTAWVREWSRDHAPAPSSRTRRSPLTMPDEGHIQHMVYEYLGVYRQLGPHFAAWPGFPAWDRQSMIKALKQIARSQLVS